MKEELKSSQEQLKVLFEFAPDAYYLHDLKGNLVDGNKATEELTGYKRKELIGKNLLKSQLFTLEQIPKAAALLAKNVLGQPTGPDEFTINCKNGKQVSVEIRTFPVKIRNRVLVLAIARDITVRKKMEKEIKKEREEIVRGQERRQLAMSLHDDLAQSMVALTLQTKFIKKYLPQDQEKIKKEIAEVDKIAKKALRDMRRLMDDLKAPRLRKLQFIPVVRKYIHDFSAKNNLPVSIEVKGYPRTLTPHYAFPLFAVIREALHNVVRHSRASQVLTEFRFSKNDLKISIEDNGCGFDFKGWQFFTNNTQALGLITIEERVGELGGTLSIKTAPGKGTKLDIFVPRKKESR